MKTSIAVLLLVVAPCALAQEVDRKPLPPEVQGAWEMVEAEPLPESEVEVIRMALSIDGNRVTQRDAFRHQGEVIEREFTVECFDIDGVIGCLPSEDGSTGYGGLGAYDIEGDTLRLSEPGGDVLMVLRRVEE